MFNGRRDDQNRLNRRDFNLLSLAAMGGLAAEVPSIPEDSWQRTQASDKVAKKELHICRGLNSCKGNGAEWTPQRRWKDR